MTRNKEMFVCGGKKENNIPVGHRTVTTTTNTQVDKVNHPSHYSWLKEVCGIEPIDILRHMNFNLGNSMKYILRCGHKTEEGITDKEKAIEDLKKAIWYIQDEIATLEKKENGIQ